MNVVDDTVTYIFAVTNSILHNLFRCVSADLNNLEMLPKRAGNEIRYYSDRQYVDFENNFVIFFGKRLSDL